MCENLTVRRAIKQGSGIPTIPVSTSHQNGDWIPTDIYVGEQYLDTDTGIVYTRNGNDIETVGGGQGQPKIWKAQITQTGTNAPVLTVLVNTLGVTVTTAYADVGEYLLNGFDLNLTGLTAVEITNANINGLIYLAVNTTSQIQVSVMNYGLSPNDDLINTAYQLSQIITVTKYD